MIFTVNCGNRFGYAYPYVFTSSNVEENIYRLNLETGKLECIYEEKNKLSDALKSKYFRISTSVEVPKIFILSMNDQNIPYRIHNLYALDSLAVIYIRIERNNKRSHLFILENDGVNWRKRKIISWNNKSKKESAFPLQFCQPFIIDGNYGYTVFGNKRTFDLMITDLNQWVTGKKWSQNLRLIVPAYCQKCVNPSDKNVQYVVLSNGDKKAEQIFIRSNGFPKKNVLFYRVKSDLDFLFTLPPDDDPLYHYFMDGVIEIQHEYLWTLGKSFFENLKR